MSLTQFWSIKFFLKILEASRDKIKKFFQILSRRSGHGAPPRGNAPEEPKLSRERERERRELPGELRDHSSSPLDKKRRTNG